MSGFLFKYSVETPDLLSMGLESYLNQRGSQGWELNTVEVNSNLFIFKQDVLPQGCRAVFEAVWRAFIDALGRGSRRA